jgi:hypothetical protein
MKLGFKKFIYVINDISNLLLDKERKDTEKYLKNLKIGLIVVIILLIFSIALNIYQYVG